MGGQNTALGNASTCGCRMAGECTGTDDAGRMSDPREFAKFLERRAPIDAASVLRLVCGPSMEKIIDLARRFRIDAGHLLEIGNRSAFDRPQRPEMPQKRPLAGRADAGNLLQPGFADVPFSALPMRPDRKAVRLIAQPFDE